MRPPIFQLADLHGHGIQTADAGAEVHADPIRRQGAYDAALLHRLDGRAYSVLGIAVGAQDLAVLHIGQGIKVPHLGAQLGFIICCIKIGDGADGIAAADQTLPGRIHVAAHRADNSQAGDHHFPVFTHNSSPCSSEFPDQSGAFRRYMAMPPSTRRTSPVTYPAQAR